jgi:hypothetical protein
MKKGKRAAMLCCLGLVFLAVPAWGGNSTGESAAQAEGRIVSPANGGDSAVLFAQISKEAAVKVYHALQGEQGFVGRIAVVNAVPLSDFKRDTEFGRVMGEYLLTDLADCGLTVTELRLGEEIAILPQTGEFILSRNIAELAGKNPALDYVVVSTFANTRKTLIVQGRLVRLSDGLIKTSWRHTLPLTGELRGLFQEAQPPYRIAVTGFSR